MTAAEAHALEPQLRCTAALWSATSGIVDSHALMLALQGELERHGGALALQSRVSGVHFAPGRAAVVRVATPEGEYELAADRVVNATGLHAPAMARCFEGLPQAELPRAAFAKGSYFSLMAPPPFSRLIYPVPVDAWLGVHVTLDLAGQVRFGPDHEWLQVETPEQLDYSVHIGRSEGFEEAIRQYWPALPTGALAPAYSGVRPKIHAPGSPAPDFRIDGPPAHGVAGLVNLFGIESPGLTSSLALAAEVRALLD
jgi:L-2-hydroxyglutarate oxidase LhgO